MQNTENLEFSSKLKLLLTLLQGAHPLVEVKKALLVNNLDVEKANLYLAQDHWRAAKLISFNHEKLNLNLMCLKKEYPFLSDSLLSEVLKNSGNNFNRAKDILFLLKLV